MVKNLSGVGLALFFAASCLGQQPPQPQEVRLSSRNYVPGLPPSDPGLLHVAVVVRDDHGKAVAGLKAQDFQVFEQDKSLPVAGVAPVLHPSTQPRFIGICIDDYGSGPGSLQRAKAIASRFVRDGLGPNDTVAIASAAHLQTIEFTTDKTKMAGAIERIEQEATPQVGVPQIVRPGQMPGTSRVPANASSGINEAFAGEVVARAVIAVIENYINQMSRMNGAREILLFSPGFQGMPQKDGDRVMSEAIAAGVVINVLDTKSAFTEVPVPAAEPVYQLAPNMYTFDPASLGLEAAMAGFAQTTGGLFFRQVSGPLSHGYRELGDLPEASYDLAVRAPEGDKNYHRIRVQSPAPGALEARAGYFPLNKAEDSGEAGARPDLRAKLDEQVMAWKPVSDFPLTPGINFSKLPNGNTAITVSLHVDIKGLQFPKRGDRYVQRLTLVAAIFDNEKMIAGKEGLMEFALSEAKYTGMQATGVGATLTMEAPPGLYRINTAVQDADGKLAGTVNSIQVP